MVDNGDINRNAGKKILIAVVEKDVDPIAFCKENELSSLIEDYLDERGDVRSINVRKYSHSIKFI